MVFVKRAGIAAILCLGAAAAARAQTGLPAPGAPLATTQGEVDFGPVPDTPRPELRVEPRRLLPPRSATDANRLDTPKETLRKAGEVIGDLATGNIDGLQRGPLLIHGNYCGIGNKPGLPPVDALDAACMRHDACTVDGHITSCACNARLRRESSAIAADPSQTEELRALAEATAASMAVLICK